MFPQISRERGLKLTHNTKRHHFSKSIGAFIITKTIREAQEALCRSEREQN